MVVGVAPGSSYYPDFKKESVAYRAITNINIQGWFFKDPAAAKEAKGFAGEGDLYFWAITGADRAESAEQPVSISYNLKRKKIELFGIAKINSESIESTGKVSSVLDLYGPSPASIVLSFSSAADIPNTDAGLPFQIQNYPIKVDPVILKLSNHDIWLSDEDLHLRPGVANMELLSFVFPKTEVEFLKLAHPRKLRQQ